MMIKIEKMCQKIMCFFIYMTLFVLMIVNLFISVNISYDDLEKVSYSFNIFYFLLGVLFIIFFFFLYRALRKISEKKLFLLLTGIYLVAALFFLYNIDIFIRADAQSVYYSAVEIQNGNYISLLKEGYLGIYPQQLGLVTYDRILNLISSDVRILYFVNFLEIILINWIGYKTTDLVFDQNQDINVIVILLEFLFLPQFFYMMFAYGLIPGFCCLSVAIYYAINFLRESSIKNGVITIIFVMLSVLLKMNFVIGAIAIGIIILLRFFTQKNWKNLLLIIGIFVSIGVSGTLIKVFYQHETGIEISDGVPATLWIAMGTDLENEQRGPGWYNAYNYVTYIQEANFDSQKASEIAKSKIMDNLFETKENPQKAIKFYGKKLVSIWCDSLYQSVWSGPSIDTEKYVDTKVLNSLYSGGKVENICQLFMKGYVVALSVFVFGFAVKRLKRYRCLEIAFLYLLGGALFHLFWEGKSQYVYPYIFLLIPAFSFELKIVFEKVMRFFNDKISVERKR